MLHATVNGVVTRFANSLFMVVSFCGNYQIQQVLYCCDTIPVNICLYADKRSFPWNSMICLCATHSIDFLKITIVFPKQKKTKNCENNIIILQTQLKYIRIYWIPCRYLQMSIKDENASLSSTVIKRCLL